MGSATNPEKSSPPEGEELLPEVGRDVSCPVIKSASDPKAARSLARKSASGSSAVVSCSLDGGLEEKSGKSDMVALWGEEARKRDEREVGRRKKGGVEGKEEESRRNGCCHCRMG